MTEKVEARWIDVAGLAAKKRERRVRGALGERAELEGRLKRELHGSL